MIAYRRVLFVARQRLLQVAALFRREPARVSGRIVEIEPGDDAQRERRNAFQQEEPAPAFDAQHAVQIQQAAGERQADHRRQRRADIKQRHGARPVAARIPAAQVENNAGRKARFRRAEQKAHHVELRRRLHQAHARGDDAPAHHDARDPAPRADARQQHVARHFEDDVGDIEYTGGDAVHLGSHRQVGVHLQRGNGDIGAVDIGNEIKHHDKGHDAQVHFLNGAEVKRVVHRKVLSSDSAAAEINQLILRCYVVMPQPVATGHRLYSCVRSSALRRCATDLTSGLISADRSEADCSTQK